MIIDGRNMAAEILAATRESIQVLGREIVVRAVVVSPTPATESYLRTKSARAEDAGMRMEIVYVAENATDQEVMSAVTALGADSVIVQLPLPDTLSQSLILDEIPLGKDADVLSSAAYERFVYREAGALLPPVTAAIKEIFARSFAGGGQEIAGKRAVVLGAGRLVGQPAAVWLEAMGADVFVLTRNSESLAEMRNADIVVLGAGSPHLVQPDMLKEGVVLIDAGTSESNGAIAGDADPACAEKASIFTPVPGGMGPIAVACLFQNAATLALQR
jgi:methylenetetrahydrofolate dehydrogenase (NADP+)/methenyltetrahydrofolate cyclohydrolase